MDVNRAVSEIYERLRYRDLESSDVKVATMNANMQIRAIRDLSPGFA